MGVFEALIVVEARCKERVVWWTMLCARSSKTVDWGS